MAMTKKDYDAVADLISGTRYLGITTEETKAIAMAMDVLTVTLADYMASTNPNFKHEVFLSAAQYGKLPRPTEVGTRA